MTGETLVPRLSLSLIRRIHVAVHCKHVRMHVNHYAAATAAMAARSGEAVV